MSSRVQDLLIISLNVNFMVLLHAVTRKLIRLTQRLKTRSRERKMIPLATKEKIPSRDLSRLITDQIVTWLLVSLAVAGLATNNVLQYPFLANQQQDFLLVQTVIALNIGRLVYVISHDTYLWNRIETSKSEMLQRIVAASSYSVALGFRENYINGVLGAFIEANIICVDILRIIKLQGSNIMQSRYKCVVYSTFAATVFFRVILLVAFLSYAVTRENPLSMHFAVTAFFFLQTFLTLGFAMWNSFRYLSKITFLCRNVEFVAPVAVDRKTHSSHSSNYCTSHTAHSSNNATDLARLKNNLSYLRPLSNQNLLCVADINIHKKCNVNSLKEPTKYLPVELVGSFCNSNSITHEDVSIPAHEPVRYSTTNEIYSDVRNGQQINDLSNILYTETEQELHDYTGCDTAS